MARPVRKKTKETRDKLLNAAENVFNTKGVSRTTLSDIAEEAGVTRGAIYWHFRNKKDLFNAMVDRVRLSINELIDKNSEQETEDPLGRFQEQSVLFMREILENPHYRKVFNILFHKCEYTDDKSEFVAYCRVWATNALESYSRTLLNARDKKQLPDDIDIDFASLMLHVVFNGLLHNWLLIPDGFNLVENSNRLFDAIFLMLKHNLHMRKIA